MHNELFKVDMGDHIVYVNVVDFSKEEMTQRFKYPYFGVADSINLHIFIRTDLPKLVYKSILAHEFQHILDRDKNYSLWTKEARAWWAGFKAQPIGFFYGIFLSLTPERINLYWKRFKENF